MKYVGIANVYTNGVLMKKMKTAIINIKTDAKTKKEAHKRAEELGFSLSSLVTASLRKIVRERRVEYNLLPEEKITPRLEKAFTKAMKDYKTGKLKSYSSAEETITCLRSL